MIFIRRSRTPATRYIALRVGLFFLAAGVWLGGYMIGDERVTTAAIIIAVVAILLGALARRKADEWEDNSSDEGPEEGD